MVKTRYSTGENAYVQKVLFDFIESHSGARKNILARPQTFSQNLFCKFFFLISLFKIVHSGILYILYISASTAKPLDVAGPGIQQRFDALMQCLSHIILTSIKIFFSSSLSVFIIILKVFFTVVFCLFNAMHSIGQSIKSLECPCVRASVRPSNFS